MGCARTDNHPIGNHSIYIGVEFEMKIGYVRVSTQEQNTIRQEVMMKTLGVDELYIDKASDKNAQRPEL